MKEKFCWKIECAHTPETIDRILLPIRKRGLMVNSLNYAVVDAKTASCTIEFEVNPSETERIYKNMIRIYDIISISRL
ncbi:MAG: hypothetical protein ACK4ND_04150 [Cytophagaceae bacterium]